MGYTLRNAAQGVALRFTRRFCASDARSLMVARARLMRDRRRSVEERRRHSARRKLLRADYTPDSSTGRYIDKAESQV